MTFFRRRKGASKTRLQQSNPSWNLLPLLFLNTPLEKAKLDGETEKEQPAHGGVVAGGASAVGDPFLTAHAVSCLKEDLEWRKKMESVAGPACQDSKPPADREGPLWDMYRKAVSEGLEVDTNTYYTMLRVKVGAPGEKGGE